MSRRMLTHSWRRAAIGDSRAVAMPMRNSPALEPLTPNAGPRS